NHEGSPEAEEESRVEHLSGNLRWEPDFAAQVVARAERAGLVQQWDGHLALTEPGRERAAQGFAA
ncbi:MAG: metal ABC transporter permease, partial [Anaerolineales bacterium]